MSYRNGTTFMTPWEDDVDLVIPCVFRKRHWDSFPSEARRSAQDPPQHGGSTVVVLQILFALAPSTGVKLSGGTLLGTYRHGTCMPWEDDVDLVISWGFRERGLQDSNQD